MIGCKIARTTGACCRVRAKDETAIGMKDLPGLGGVCWRYSGHLCLAALNPTAFPELVAEPVIAQ